MRSDFRPLPNKKIQIWDSFFPLLFLKDSESLKIVDIRLQEVGAKIPVNGTSKVNTQTDRQTNTQTNIWTFRVIKSIGPEGRCFENHPAQYSTALGHGRLQSGAFTSGQSEEETSCSQDGAAGPLAGSPQQWGLHWLGSGSYWGCWSHQTASRITLNGQ